jgi:hypothetical protein
MFHHLGWSRTERTIAKKAYNEAYAKECNVVVARVKDLLAELPEPNAVWLVHDFLSQRRKDIDEKYRYRYSRLPLVFARLIREGWLTLDDLQGLGEEKIRAIQIMLKPE